jgi:hypothetical protein
MLDWFSGYVGYDASQLRLGEFFEVDPHGAVVKRRPRWETARGSYSSSIQLTCAAATEQMLTHGRSLGFLCSSAVLQVSGNPTKFLQGHNVTGPSVSQLGPMLQAVARALGEGMRPPDADDPALPAVQRSRVDVTTACDLGSHQAVHDYLRHVAATGRSRHGRALDSSGTVYFGKHSTRWALKFYCKHCELRAHPPEVSAELLADLLEWTRTHLRIELVLRRPELKNRGTLSESIIWEFFQRLEISAMAPKYDPKEGLRVPVKLALAAWYEGHDLAVMLPRRTLYRYRREILDANGIDVLLPRASQPEGASRALLSMDELRAREVKPSEAPSRIQRSLFGAG